MLLVKNQSKALDQEGHQKLKSHRQSLLKELSYQLEERTHNQSKHFLHSHWLINQKCLQQLNKLCP